MRDCSAQLADAELVTAHRENRREDVQRESVHWRWRAYLGLNGGHEEKAIFLPVVQGHVPVPAQIAFHLRIRIPAHLPDALHWSTGQKAGVVQPPLEILTASRVIQT